VPAAALVQAKAPVRREYGSEFHSLCPTEHKDQLPAVPNLKRGTARVGVSEEDSLNNSNVKDFPILLFGKV